MVRSDAVERQIPVLGISTGSWVMYVWGLISLQVIACCQVSPHDQARFDIWSWIQSSNLVISYPKYTKLFLSVQQKISSRIPEIFQTNWRKKTKSFCRQNLLLLRLNPRDFRGRHFFLVGNLVGILIFRRCIATMSYFYVQPFNFHFWSGRQFGRFFYFPLLHCNRLL